MAEVLPDKKFRCAFCGGSGVQPHSLHSRCSACRGKGEVEFEGPVLPCSLCHGKGRVPPSGMLSCIRCGGVGVIEKSVVSGDVGAVIGKRLGEITKKLRWTRKETEKKTKEIEKRLKPVKPFIKEVKKETLWIKKLGNEMQKGWKSPWEP